MTYIYCVSYHVYLIGVCSVLVLGSVWRVGESLVAALVLTHIRFLAGVRAQMSLQVLQTRVRFITAFELMHMNINVYIQLFSREFKQKPSNRGVTHSALVRFLAGVSAHVDHQHVLRLEGPLLSRAVLPVTHELLLLPVDVLVIDVLCKRKRNHAKWKGMLDGTPGASVIYILIKYLVIF